MLSDKVIIDAIEQYESGVSVKDIFHVLHIIEEDDQQELKGMLKVLDIMSDSTQQLEMIKPSKQALEIVVDQYPGKPKSFLERFNERLLRQKNFLGASISLALCVMVGGLYWFKQPELISLPDHDFLFELESDIEKIEAFDAQTLALKFEAFEADLNQFPAPDTTDTLLSQSPDKLSMELVSLENDLKLVSAHSPDDFEARFDTFINSF